MHDKQLGMKDFACTISPFRKSKKKRSRSSSSSSSSSSRSQKEDLPLGNTDPKDKGFNKARLGQRESPGSVERGRPLGGFVSLTHDVGLMEEKWLCIFDFHSSLRINDFAAFQFIVFFCNYSKSEFVEGAGTEAIIRETVHRVTTWQTWQYTKKMKTGTQSTLPRAENTTW